MLEIKDLGIRDYKEVWDLQRMLQQEIISQKKDKGRVEKEYLLLVEHPDVITLGRHAKTDNLLLSRQYYADRGVGVYDIERGGDVTYHGPGQLVVYPIIDLEKHKLGVKKYVELLEEIVIRLLADINIHGERVDGATGVWIGKDGPEERKICAIGVKCSRFVTMHGLGLNVNTDLSKFSMINPCGFIDKGVTSIEKEKGFRIDMSEIKKRIINLFSSSLD